MAETRKKTGGAKTAKKTTAKAEAKEEKALPETGAEQEKKAEAVQEERAEAEAPKETASEQKAPEQKAPEIPAPIIVQAPPTREPMVEILYMDSCIEGNQIPIGGGRIISGSGKRFKVTLSDFEGVFQTPLVSYLLKKRKFIVLSGLDEELRKQYGVDYKEGEIIKKEGTFDFLISCRTEEAAEIFAALCRDHREMAAARIISAYMSGDNRLSRDKLEKLNAISKKDYPDGRGIFTPMLKEMNDAEI